jgi:PKD repeat protein
MALGRILPALPLILILSSLIAFSADTDIFISEIQIAGEHKEDKFIELYNPNTNSGGIDISGYKLRRKTSGVTEDSVIEFKNGSIIPAKGYFLWGNSDGIFKSPLADAETKAAPTNNNSIALYKKSGTQYILIDSVAWGSGKAFDADTFLQTDNIPASKSLMRSVHTLQWSVSDTPTPTNSHGQTLTPSPPPPADPAPPAGGTSLRINELLPNPVGSDTGKEWIELFNFGTTPINLKNWSFVKKSGSLSPLAEQEIASHGFLTIPLSLNNTSETISLLDPSKNIVSQVSYEHAPSGDSLNFFTQGTYRWSKTPTPGSDNIVGNAPETKDKDIPDTAYLGVLTAFSASGKDDDGDTIKYTWDFGDGHKSYKRETAHRYDEEGKYEGTLTITDGTESDITPFTIEVEKYEAPKVRMTALVPNPTGRDTDTEYITLENRSRKSVDLLGWSIATGWKKLVNHPIRESFIIPRKSKRNITHTFLAFTLPNEKARIELRSPDGGTVQKLKYNLKGKSAGEDALLVKEKGKRWEWILPQLTESSKQTTAQTADAPPAGLPESLRESLRAGGTTAVVDREEEQLKRDTETITLKKQRGEKAFSGEQNPADEMRKLIGFGTDIETPIAVLSPDPAVAGASDELSPSGQDGIDDGFDLNALINHWLAKE